RSATPVRGCGAVAADDRRHVRRGRTPLRRVRAEGHAREHGEAHRARTGNRGRRDAGGDDRGRDRGAGREVMADAGPSPLRSALWPLGLVYGGALALRNRLYDARLCAVHRLPVPVVSIGNLTVGGTGKTPAVAWLCALAKARGKRPGVLARGYGRASGALL